MMQNEGAKPAVQWKSYLLLHGILFLYSLNGILSKFAAQHAFLSFDFFLFYGLILLNLGVYAILWQQVLKRLPLVTAFSNKSVTIVWSMIWGALLFQEKIRITMIIGAMIIFVGVYLVVSDRE